MKDEVRITVVATGFSERIKKPLEKIAISQNVYRPSTFIKKETFRSEEDYEDDEPTVIMPPKETPPINIPKTSDEEDLEIPAFIRKKIKK